MTLSYSYTVHCSTVVYSEQVSHHSPNTVRNILILITGKIGIKLGSFILELKRVLGEIILRPYLLAFDTLPRLFPNRITSG